MQLVILKKQTNQLGFICLPNCSFYLFRYYLEISVERIKTRCTTQAIQS